MHWKVPEFSRSQIIKAGKIIKSKKHTQEELDFSLQVMDNWRSSHAYPLQVIYCHLRKQCNLKNYIVAQRLKRLVSIEKKLQREPNMSLWTIQDLGGCRVIVPTVQNVYDVVSAYKKSRVRHKLKKEYDYILSPKKSGYRSYHMVYQFQSDKKSTYNRNILIEIQVRTKLQHLWATAVETIGIFTNQSLKASCGKKETLRFLSLISSLFAIKEKGNIIPDTPSDINMIIKELTYLEQKNKYFEMLSAIRVATKVHKDRSHNKQGYFLLTLNYITRKLSMKFYKLGEVNTATAEYQKQEKCIGENLDVVLVSVNSFNKLKTAYPNYFTDINDFIKKTQELIYSMSTNQHII